MASGDLKYEESVSGKLTAAQKAALKTLVEDLWSGALAAVTNVLFYRDGEGGVLFQLSGEQTKAPSLVPLGCRITGRVP